MWDKVPENQTLAIKNSVVITVASADLSAPSADISAQTERTRHNLARIGAQMTFLTFEEAFLLDFALALH